MTAQVAEAAACLHACQDGCGRTYDIVIIQVVDGSTSFYCIPCFMGFAHQVMTAMVEPDNAQVSEVVGKSDFSDITFVEVGGVTYNVNPTLPPAPDDEFSFDGVSEE